VSGLLGLVPIAICSFSRVRTIHHADTLSSISGVQRTIAHGSTRAAGSANARARQRRTATVSDETADRRQPGGAAGWAVAAAAHGSTVVLMGPSLPTPLYPLYEDSFGFGTAFTSQLFAIYALGVIATLVLFGRLSDGLGRRPLLAAGVVFSIASAVL